MTIAAQPHRDRARHNRGRHSLRALTALCVGASMVAGAAVASASTPQRASHLSAVASPATSLTSSTVLVSGIATPAVPGLGVTLLRWDNGHWRTVAHAHQSRTGSYSLPVKMPGKAGAVALRVVHDAGSTVKAAVSPTLHVAVVTTGFTVRAAATADSLASTAPVTVTGTVSPAANGVVVLQRLVAGRWSDLASAPLTHAAYSFSLAQPAGTYVLRVAKAYTTKVAAGASSPFTVTVQALAAPAPLHLAPAPTAPPISPIPPAALSITTTALPAGVAHQPYRTSLLASGGSAPYDWKLVSGTLPAGLVLLSDGTIGGTPAVGGVAALTVSATDSAGRTVTADLSISVPALTGSVAMWGLNSDGELGDGLPTDLLTPQAVSGLGSVKQLTSAGHTDYALTAAGGVLAWGAGDAGELGAYTTAYSASPVAVPGLASGVIAIAAAAQTGYALRSDGTVWAWGSDAYGELGDGIASGGRAQPHPIDGLGSVVAIAAMSNGALALESDGTVWEWGTEYGAGQGWYTGPSNATPVERSGLGGRALAIAAGAGDFALMADGSVRAWGYNGFEDLGDGTTTNRNTPFRVAGLPSHVTAIVPGASATYALTSSGAVWAWGEGANGQLGDGGTADRAVPGAVPGLTHVTSLVAVDGAAFAQTSDGAVQAWGDNSDGEIGDGTTTNRLSPVTEMAVPAGAKLFGGEVSGFAVATSGAVTTWGVNVLAYDIRAAAQPVAGLPAALAVSGDSAALTADGRVWDWGGNYWGALGNGSPQSFSDVPVPVSGLSGVTALASSLTVRWALKSDGTVWGWGENPTFTAGDSLTEASVPVQIPGLSGITAIALEEDAGFALSSDGTVWALGDNFGGHLGDGTEVTPASPVKVAALPGVVGIAAGGDAAYAIDAQGQVWAWGDNTAGQLGNGTTTSGELPAKVIGLSGVGELGTDGESVYAVLTDGSVDVWGWAGSLAGLGSPPSGTQTVPVAVPGLSDVSMLTVGAANGYALLDNGTVMSWGWGDFGGLGNGSVADEFTPTVVPGLTGAVQLDASGSSVAVLRRSTP